MTEPGWEPAVPLGERLAWAVLLGGLPCLAAVGRLDLFSLIFASLWSALIVGGCAVGHRPRHERRGEVVTDSVMGSAARGGPESPNLRLVCSHQHCNPVGGRTWWCADCGVEFEGLLLAEIEAAIEAETETPDG